MSTRKPHKATFPLFVKQKYTTRIFTGFKCKKKRKNTRPKDFHGAPFGFTRNAINGRVTRDF